MLKSVDIKTAISELRLFFIVFEKKQYIIT